MPPTQKKEVATERGSFLKKGAIVSLEKGGRTLTGLEVIDFDETFVKFRWNMTISPQTEIVLVPWQKIEAIGLEGER
jgi:sporulation protein YlmC with PRC-barrel domain